MDELLRNLLDALDLVGDAHEEIYDTECRVRMGDPIFFLFIKPKAEYVMSDNFGLNSDDANRQVKAAISHYIRVASERAQSEGLSTFHERLAAFQNGSVRSTKARNYFDDFFGWSNPANFDQDGNVIGRA
jgi:hypothetical protein